MKKFSDHANIYGNLKSIIDVGFVDANNYDLHLNSSSEAIDYCNGLTDYPIYDIDGDVRSQSNLNAGADENN